MAFTVTLYTFSKKTNSTARPPAGTTSADFNCVLKDTCGIMAPRIALDLGIVAAPYQYNYAYIPAFNRYYFVTEWAFESRLWVAYLEEDTLASFKDAFLPQSFYVLRSASAYNGLLMDERYPTKPEALVRSVRPAENKQMWSFDMEAGRYVVGIINNTGASMGAVAYYVMTGSEFEAFCSYLMSNTGYLQVPTSIAQGGISDELLKTLFNPIQYVASVKWFPFTPPVTGPTLQAIPYGWWSLTGLHARVLDMDYPYADDCYFNIPEHPQAASRGEYLQAAPYTRLTLDFGPFGEIPLDADVFHAGTILYCQWWVDCITGIGKLQIATTRTGTVEDFVVRTLSADCGVPIQISQMGIDRLAQGETIQCAKYQAASNIFGTVGAAGNISNLLNPLTGSMDVAASAAQTFEAIEHNVADGIRASLPQMASTGVNGTVAAYYYPPKLRATFFELVAEDLADNGRPLAEMRVLNTLTGYVLVKDGNVKIAGTVSEQAAVRHYLESGLFIED